MSKWPWAAARCNGISSPILVELTRAPRCKSISTNLVWPFIDTQCNKLNPCSSLHDEKKTQVNWIIFFFSQIQMNNGRKKNHVAIYEWSSSQSSSYTHTHAHHSFKYSTTQLGVTFSLYIPFMAISSIFRSQQIVHFRVKLWCADFSASTIQHTLDSYHAPHRPAIISLEWHCLHGTNDKYLPFWLARALCVWVGANEKAAKSFQLNHIRRPDNPNKNFHWRHTHTHKQ